MQDIICYKVSGEIKERGALHPKKYQKCPPLCFYQHWLGKNILPQEQAVAYIAQSEKGICYYALLNDQHIFSTATENQQRLWELGDVVEFFIKPDPKQNGYWEIHVAPNGLFLDLYIPLREKARSGEIAWQQLIQAKSNCLKKVWVDKEQNRWTVELCVPWQTFGLNKAPAEGTCWQVALCRYNYSHNLEDPELSSTVALKELDFHRYEDYHLLCF